MAIERDIVVSVVIVVVVDTIKLHLYRVSISLLLLVLHMVANCWWCFFWHWKLSSRVSN